MGTELTFCDLMILTSIGFDFIFLFSLKYSRFSENLVHLGGVGSMRLDDFFA